ncbi:MAG: DUF3224 domain-containing protein [Gammaproteobacteria bacterium]
MLASGTFSVKLTPQDDDRFPAGRMLIRKTYAGELTANATGQMISKRTDSGPAVYYALEEVAGSLAGKKGCFTLLHKGYMDQNGQVLDVSILQGSGTGDFQGISGSMVIEQIEEGHEYRLTYEL